jgi:RNA polymerase sigma factor (sigma-70 family)
LNNAEFVDGLRNHDPEAAKHLRDCFVPTVWRFVYVRVGGDSHLAEDITSEAVLALVAAIGQGIDIQCPSAWLRCVAQRKLPDHFRAAARVQHLMQQAGSSTSGQTDETPATQHDRKLLRKEVRSSIDLLPEPQQLALQWKYIDRISVREIEPGHVDRSAARPVSSAYHVFA